MTKKVFAKGLLQGEIQICHCCIYWKGMPYLNKRCAKKGRITSLYDSCFQWQWNKKLK